MGKRIDMKFVELAATCQMPWQPRQGGGGKMYTPQERAQMAVDDAVALHDALDAMHEKVAREEAEAEKAELAAREQERLEKEKLASAGGSDAGGQRVKSVDLYLGDRKIPSQPGETVVYRDATGGAPTPPPAPAVPSGDALDAPPTVTATTTDGPPDASVAPAT